MTHKGIFCVIFIAVVAALVSGCGNSGKQPEAPAEDLKAKAMLAGIWIDSDEENVVFKIKGDTIYYPDSTTQPVKFKIVQDTMVLLGNTVSKYPIVHKSEHLFEFKNQDNDIVKLVRSEDPNDSLSFVRHRPIVLNQGKVIKSDTIVTYSGQKYHSYVQVNPTTFKVYRSFYNAEGMEIENIYYDNIIHVSVFKGATKLFSKDFRKNDFVKAVPSSMLKQCVLSDIRLSESDAEGFHYITQLAIPDSPSSFVVELIVTFNGGFSVRRFEDLSVK